MPKDMHDVVRKKLITSFKRYPTTVQDTLLQIIGDRLQESYDLTEDFAEIMLKPDYLRPDIVKAKAKQYDFDIREEASLSEQIKLLEAVNKIYSKRGSIESIEKMWTYYGGNLPKNVKVEIPASDIFRYNISKFSGTSKFQDGDYYRSGVYNINIEGDYDLKSLRDFVNRELRAAGTKINYIKRISSVLSGSDSEDGSSMASDNVYEDTILYTISSVSLNRSGLTWSSYSPQRTWSGRANLFVDIALMYELGIVSIGDIIPYELNLYTAKSALVIITSNDNAKRSTILHEDLEAVCTPSGVQNSIEQHFYDTEGNEIINNSKYPGYFILGESLLGEVITK